MPYIVIIKEGATKWLVIDEEFTTIPTDDPIMYSNLVERAKTAKTDVNVVNIENAQTGATGTGNLVKI